MALSRVLVTSAAVSDFDPRLFTLLDALRGWLPGQYSREWSGITVDGVAHVQHSCPLSTEGEWWAGPASDTYLFTLADLVSPGPRCTWCVSSIRPGGFGALWFLRAYSPVVDAYSAALPGTPQAAVGKALLRCGPTEALTHGDCDVVHDRLTAVAGLVPFEWWPGEFLLVRRVSGSAPVDDRWAAAACVGRRLPHGFSILPRLPGVDPRLGPEGAAVVLPPVAAEEAGQVARTFSALLGDAKAVLARPAVALWSSAALL
ncbi:MAG: hypothetical protein ACOYO9_11155 [Candidatus Nanopelagicales bacterium]